MHRRLLKVLALLDSDNDAEALQALRTAQVLLGKSNLSFGQIMETLMARAAPISQSAPSPELAALQMELKRYRVAWESVAKELAEVQKENERLRAHLEAKDGLKLFVRLRERENNVTALTQEIRRLKDELFKAEHRKRSQGEKRKSARGTVFSPDHDISATPTSDDLVGAWFDLVGLVVSDNPRHWISARELFELFLKGHVSFGQRRVRPGRGVNTSPVLRRRVSREHFVKTLTRLLGVEPTESPASQASRAPKSSDLGFCVVSRFDDTESQNSMRGA